MRSTVLSRIPRRGTLVVAATLLALVNCEQVEITTVSAARVELQPQNASIAVSESARLTATVLSSDGKTLSGRSIEWSSLQTNIATVDNTGMVRGMATGVATIRAVSGDASGTAAVTVTAAPTIAVTPTEILFSAIQNGSAPGDRTATVTNGGTGSLSGLTATVRYAAGEPNNWLTASLAGTTAPTALILSANQRNFAPGTYNATVDIASSITGVVVRQLPVRLTVLTPSPAIGLGSNSIAFAATTGGADPAQQTVGVTNAGGGTLTGLATTIDYQPGQRTGWLTASLSGTGAPATLTLRAATAGVPAGNYTANVRVTSGVAQNSPQTVTVTFAVTATQTSIALDQRTLTFTASRGGANPGPLAVQVTSASSTPIAGLAATIAYTAGPPGWATATLNTTTTPATLTVSAATGSLPTGIHTAVVSVASPNATNSPQRIDVAFNVVDPLNAPTNLTATSVSSSQINLSWTAPAGVVTRYRIERKAGAGGTYAVVDSTTTNSYQSVGLNPATQYFYRVSACNPLNCSPPSAEANATTGPGAPGSLTASAISSTQIDLVWNASVGTVTRYRIERKTGAAGTYAVIDSVAGGTLTYSNGGLAPATQYFYRVQACNGALCSSYSGEANATTGQIAPGAPPSLTATAAGSSQINLAWGAASGAVTRYRIERKTGAGGTFAAIDSVAAGVTTYANTGLSGATQYFYRVQACNSAGCSPYSVEANATTAQVPPGVPAGITVTTVSSTEVNVTWGAATGTVDYFKVERKLGPSGTYAVVDSVGPATFSSLSTGLQPSTTYFFRVGACNTAGCSTTGEIFTTTFPPPPAAPTNLTAKLASTGLAIDLSWTGSAPPVNKYVISRRAGTSGALVPWDSVAANVGTYQDTRVSAGTEYTYEVRACNAGGCSGPSNQATQLTVPGVPAALLAAAVSSSQINLSWAAVTGATAYYIESRTGSAAYAGLATVPTGPYQHTGLTASTIYFYHVAACNTAGCSAFSVEASDTTLVPPPGPPNGLTASTISSSEIKLTWNASADSVSVYRIERSTSGSPVPVDSVPGSTLTYNNTGLSAGTQYTYQVRACNRGGCSAPTNQATAFTIPAAPASVTATAVSATRIDVTWPASTGAITYIVDRGGTQVTVNTASYSDTTVVEQTTYTYQVKACNVGGCSGFSPSGSATTPVAAPSKPATLTATAFSTTEIDLAWSLSSGTSPKYYIERRPTSGTFVTIDSTSTGSYRDAGLTPAAAYEYRVRACNAGGCSAPSPSAITTTQPDIPTGLAATIEPTTRTSISINWNTVTGSATYELEKVTDEPGASKTFTGIAAPPFSDSPVIALLYFYKYRVRACTSLGVCSAFSTQVTAN